MDPENQNPMEPLAIVLEALDVAQGQLADALDTLASPDRTGQREVVRASGQVLAAQRAILRAMTQVHTHIRRQTRA